MPLMPASTSFATESGHWYTAAGAPAYTIIGSNGKERATTVRDARKLGLLPSVTTICNLEAKPQLTRWMIQQAMMACLTLPRIDGETDDAFMARATDDSQQQARTAADRGTRLHGAIETAMRGGVVDAADRQIVQPVLDWIHTTFAGYDWHPERSFASPALGFGGKIDLFGTGNQQAVVIDFKCKAGIAARNKSAKDLAFDQHITQLAAYAVGLGHPSAACINLFIDSDVPGCIVVKNWSASEIEDGWRAFDCLLRLFQIRKGLI